MSQLSREIEATRGSYWERERQAARNTTVLLVEGDDDKAVMEELLRRRRPAFPTQVSVVVAGSRKNVLAGASIFPNHALHLLVDRDTWTDTEVEDQVMAPMLLAARGPRANWRVEVAGAVGRPPPFDLLLAQLLP